MEVGRVKADFNGDGYSDVAVGASGQIVESFEAGSVFVFPGGPAGIVADGGLEIPNPVPDEWGRFGSAVADGDVDGDGFAELLVGAPEQGLGGRSFVFAGSASGLDAGWSVTIDLPTPDASAWFGGRIASGRDLNGDGLADALVSAPYLDRSAADQGSVFVFLGSPTGLDVAGATSLAGPSAARDFGIGVSLVDDLNGDGLAEILVASGSAGGATPMVWLYDGDRSGAPAGPSMTLPWPGLPGWLFTGFVAGIGDADGDAFGGIAAGVCETAGGGAGCAVAVYAADGSGVPRVPTSVLRDARGTPWFEDHLTASDAGDVDGDGLDDLVVGTPERSRAYLYLGDPGGWAEPPAVVLEGADGFGQAVAGAGDVDGDGYADVVVGAPNDSSVWYLGGSAVVFLGSADGLSAVSPVTVSGEQSRAQMGIDVD